MQETGCRRRYYLGERCRRSLRVKSIAAGPHRLRAGNATKSLDGYPTTSLNDVPRGGTYFSVCTPRGTIFVIFLGVLIFTYIRYLVNCNTNKAPSDRLSERLVEASPRRCAG